MLFFFFNDPAPTEIYPLPHHDALRICRGFSGEGGVLRDLADPASSGDSDLISALLAFEPRLDVGDLARRAGIDESRVLRALDRKSTRLNSSHANISYAVFCLKKKKITA